MSYLAAALFIGLGLILLLSPEWLTQLHREHKAFGTKQESDEVELEEWWEQVDFIVGILTILFGMLILFGVI